jgi:hypothetical protein
MFLLQVDVFLVVYPIFRHTHIRMNPPNLQAIPSLDHPNTDLASISPTKLFSAEFFQR